MQYLEQNDPSLNQRDRLSCKRHGGSGCLLSTSFVEQKSADTNVFVLVDCNYVVGSVSK